MSQPREDRRRIEALRARLAPCVLCPRNCRVDRLTGEVGFCRAGARATVASAGPHFGEEPCLVGAGGSGTIFLAGCNLGCVFCQNCDISRSAAGREMDAAELASLALGLERRGCANINFVTPTHVAHAVAEAVVEARRGGLRVPVVWNSSGYEAAETLRLLDGLVEIYMPDLKFLDVEASRLYLEAADYPDRVREALREMHRQVGDIEADPDGVARRGLLVRHLVMPGHSDDARAALDFLASLSPRTAVNVMGQYRPAAAVSSPEGRRRYAAIARRPSQDEIARARGHAEHLGLRLVD